MSLNNKQRARIAFKIAQEALNADRSFIESQDTTTVVTTQQGGPNSGVIGMTADSVLVATLNNQGVLNFPLFGTEFRIGNVPVFRMGPLSTSQNTFLGQNAGSTSLSVFMNNNVAIGFDAGKSLSTGQINAMFGVEAGDALTSGNLNTFLGPGAGSTIITGGQNVLIGERAGRNLPTSQNGMMMFEQIASGGFPLLTGVFQSANLGIGGLPATSGTRCVRFTNGTLPAAAAGGGSLAVVAGALTYIGAAGTVTVLGLT